MIYGKRFKTILALSTSLFFYLFLIFFQPFGVDNYRPNTFIPFRLIVNLSLFIPTVLLTVWLGTFLVLKLFPKINFIVFSLIILLVTSSATFFTYNFLGDFHDYSFLSYGKHVVEATSILSFPVFGTYFYFKYFRTHYLFKNKRHIQSLKISNELILFKSDYKNDEIALRLKQIICILSQDNYAQINYFSNDNTLRKHLIRTTLSTIEKYLDSKYFYRCNRSIIINLLHIKSYRKFNAKLVLELDDFEKEIKVSYSRIKVLEEKIKNFFN